MRTSTAYFAGAGTVVAAIVAGLGGGLLIANIVSPHSSKNGTEMTRREQRMSAQPIPVIAAPSEPVPYVAATQAAAATNVVATPMQNQVQQPQPQTDPANARQAAAPPAEPATAREASNAPAAAPEKAASTNAPTPAPEKAASTEDDNAKARDADINRVSAEKRRAERRQQWAEKRQYQRRQDRDLREVEQKVREDTEPVRVEMPRVKFFDVDD
jgi:hypothetical protein